MDEIVSESFYKGAISLMQVSGLGSLRPNVIQLGFSRYWEKSAAEGGTLGKVESKEKMQSNSTEIHEYIKVCDAAIKMHYGLVIASSLQTVAWDSYTQPGEVHIWWMAPDGGLTILLPQIMAKSPYWRKRVKKAKLFFVLPGNDSDEEVRDGILTAVDRLRIKMQPVFVSLRQNNPLDTANGEPDGPTKETVATYEGLAGVNPIGNQNNAKVDLRWVYRWLRISELVKENSSRAKFIYSSMPKKPPHCEPLDWYGILHMLQVSGPPMAMIAGNNINCLTMFQE
jgi:sodium/chloride transporter 3